MIISTEQEFYDFLDDDLAPRFKEIVSLISVVSDAPAKHRDILLRVSFPMVYAHWEGYVKSGADAVMYYVSSRKRRYRELATGFAVCGLKSELGKLARDVTDKSTLVNSLPALVKKVDEEFDCHVDSRSLGIMRYEVLSKVATTIGCRVDGFAAYKGFLHRLVNMRNQIAHGESNVPDMEGFIKDAYTTIKLLQMYKDILIDHVRCEGYRQPW